MRSGALHAVHCDRYSRSNTVLPALSRFLRPDERASRLTQMRAPSKLPYRSKLRHARRPQTEREDRVAKSRLAVDMRRDRLPRQTLVDDHLIGHRGEKAISHQPPRNRQKPVRQCAQVAALGHPPLKIVVAIPIVLDTPLQVLDPPCTINISQKPRFIVSPI